MLVCPNPHNLLTDSQYLWSVCVCVCVLQWGGGGVLDRGAGRSRQVLGTCDLGRTFSRMGVSTGWPRGVERCLSWLCE